MENAGFYVYLWSIYGSITTIMNIVVFLSWSCFLLILVAFLAEFSMIQKLEDTKNLPVKKTLAISIVLTLINIALPSKTYLPYILAATPISKAIIESATSEDGKINKVDKLIDMSLDKAIEAIQNSAKDNK